MYFYLMFHNDINLINTHDNRFTYTLKLWNTSTHLQNYFACFYSWLIPGFVTEVTQMVSLMEQTLFTLHSTVWPRFLGCSFWLYVVLCCRPLSICVFFFFFWPLYCKCFLKLQFLFTPLASLDLSKRHHTLNMIKYI